MKLVFSTLMLLCIRTTQSTKRVVFDSRSIITIIFVLITCFNLQRVFAGSTVRNYDSIRSVSQKSNTVEFKLRETIVQQALQEHHNWRNGTTLREQDSAAASLLEKYWNSVGKSFHQKNYNSPEWQEDHPWSAVFISYIMKQAGAADQFKYSETHSNYIVWARNNTSTKADCLFEIYDISDSLAAWPQPGDILCKNRDGKNYDLYSISSGCISHCDIVVEVDTLAKAVYTIGGNLNNTVAKRLVWLNEKGLVNKSATWLLIDEDWENKEGEQKDYFAIIRLKEKKKTSSTKEKSFSINLLNNP